MVLSAGASAQVKRTSVPVDFISEMPREDIHVHLNSTVFFPGEYLLYSLYTLNAQTGKASTLSKVAYVELIGEKQGQVFHHRLNLEQGKGSSDYFVTTNIPSGKYKLVAYTNWMRNFKDNFFEGDVIIINPYQSDQRNLLNQNKKVSDIAIPMKGNAKNEAIDNRFFEFSLNKRHFRKRDQVLLNLSKNGNFNGTFSLSVRKLSELPSPERKSAAVFPSGKTTSPKNVDEEFFLPELRGPILSGKAEHTDSKDTKIQGNIIFSIPSDDYLAQIVNLRQDGKFLLNLDGKNRGGEAVISFNGNDKEQIEIHIDEFKSLGRKELVFADYTISPEMEEIIIKRSLYNQIENAYFSAKPDTLVTEAARDILPAELVEIYHLDEFTRFETVSETFVEIIKSAWTTRTSEGHSIIEVRGFENTLGMGQQALVVIDGIVEQDHENFIRMDAEEIKTIKIVRDMLFIGPENFPGAVVVETHEGDYIDRISTASGERVKIPTAQIPKKYFRQTYENQSEGNTIPDYRFQLFWNPDITIQDEKTVLEFFTSDVEGEFEIVLEGFTNDGQAVSLKEQFIVE